MKESKNENFLYKKEKKRILYYKLFTLQLSLRVDVCVDAHTHTPAKSSYVFPQHFS